jgi:hypothetical protein
VTLRSRRYLVGQSILAAGFQPALFASRYVGLLPPETFLIAPLAFL